MSNFEDSCFWFDNMDYPKIRKKWNQIEPVINNEKKIHLNLVLFFEESHPVLLKTAILIKTVCQTATDDQNIRRNICRYGKTEYQV